MCLFIKKFLLIARKSLTMWFIDVHMSEPSKALVVVVPSFFCDSSLMHSQIDDFSSWFFFNVVNSASIPFNIKLISWKIQQPAPCIYTSSHVTHYEWKALWENNKIMIVVYTMCAERIKITSNFSFFHKWKKNKKKLELRERGKLKFMIKFNK